MMHASCDHSILRFPTKFADVVSISPEENANLQAAALAGDPLMEEFVDLVAEEVAIGIHKAVGYWMGRLQAVFQDTRLTTLGRMHAIQDILAEYKQATGEDELPAFPAVERERPGHDD
jgi:hypothetical protein